MIFRIGNINVLPWLETYNSAVCGETYQERTNDDNDMAATGHGHRSDADLIQTIKL